MQPFPHLSHASLAAGKGPLFQRGSGVDRSPGNPVVPVQDWVAGKEPGIKTKSSETQSLADL